MSQGDIIVLMDAISSRDGYPKLKELAKMVPSLTPLQLNAAVRYLERCGAIVIDGDGYIVWSRKDKPDTLTLADVADISADFKHFIDQNSE